MHPADDAAFVIEVDPTAAGELPQSAAFAALARRLAEQLGPLAAEVGRRLDAALPAWASEQVFSEEEVVDFVRESLRGQLACLRRDQLPRRCPPPDAAAARSAARLGALRFLLDAYRVFQFGLWQAWFELIEAEPLPGAERDALLGFGSQFLALYAERLRDQVTELYQDELGQLVRSGEQRRLQSVRSVLAGEPSAAAQIELELERHHLGLLASAGAGEAAARRLAALLERPLLLLAPINRRCWGWISGARPLSPAEERIVVDFEPGEDARLALGLEGFGEAGFRATNREATRAWRLAPVRADHLIRYADLTVEAMIAESQPQARAFIARELRGINDETTASRRIRETIAAYFAAEHNAASAAAALGIHQQTVANRLRAAEERLGHPVAARRLELEAALRLRACLGGAGEGPLGLAA